MSRQHTEQGDATRHGTLTTPTTPRDIIDPVVSAVTHAGRAASVGRGNQSGQRDATRTALEPHINSEHGCQHDVGNVVVMTFIWAVSTVLFMLCCWTGHDVGRCVWCDNS